MPTVAFEVCEVKGTVDPWPPTLARPPPILPVCLKGFGQVAI